MVVFCCSRGKREVCDGCNPLNHWSGKRDLNPRPSPWQDNLTSFRKWASCLHFMIFLCYYNELTNSILYYIIYPLRRFRIISVTFWWQCKICKYYNMHCTNQPLWGYVLLPVTHTSQNSKEGVYYTRQWRYALISNG